MLDGYSASVPLLRTAIAEVLATNELRGFNLASIAAADLWDLDAYVAVTRRWISLARAQGALGLLPLALAINMGAEFLSGRLTVSRAVALEGLEISNSATHILGTAGRRGDPEHAQPENTRRAIGAHLQWGIESNQGRTVHRALLALSELELGLGNCGGGGRSHLRGRLPRTGLGLEHQDYGRDRATVRRRSARYVRSDGSHSGPPSSHRSPWGIWRETHSRRRRGRRPLAARRSVI
jgi:hypothetical protein